ncbi:MAG: hypothetical protein WBA54_11995, partial [Acidaminobacteraceae bacterium]
MKTCCRWIIVILLFIISAVVTYSYDESDKNILILNSYDSENIWTKSQVKAVIDTLNESDVNYNLYVEYMDVKRFSEDTHLKQIFNYLYNKYLDQKIDYIIATDDSAFLFLNKNSSELFGDAKIVFSGLNYLYDMDRSRFTGVYENIDIKSNIEFAIKLFPKTQNVYILGEDQVTTRSIALEINDYTSSGGYLNVEMILNNNVKFLKSQIEGFPENSIVFFTMFNMDDEGNRYSYESGFNKIMDNTEIPIFSFWSFYDELPIVGGYFSNAYLSGVDATLILLQIADGKSTDSIKISESKKVYKLNSKTLQSFGLSNIKLDETVEYTNKPISFIGKYKNLLMILILIVMLSSNIIILLYKNNFYSKENDRLVI